MGIDWNNPDVWLVIAALVAFNVPIAWALLRLRKVQILAEPADDKGAKVPLVDGKPSAFAALVQEKSADGSSTGAISFSRVTGLLGAVVVASLFWIMSNVSIAVAILNPGGLPDMLNGITKLFFVGAALFLPYAFNQLKALIQ